MNGNFPRAHYHFPKQRVNAAERNKPEWYANCIDFVIDAGMSFKDETGLNNRLDILHGDIPNTFYKKTLNPYNSNKEKYQRFPATMRNLDIMRDVIRRYVSEYVKGIHDFHVGSNSPEVIINKDAKLKEKVTLLAEQAFVQEFERKYQEAVNNADPNQQQQIDPSQLMPNIEDFIKQFNDNYIDEQSEQGQQLLDYIQDHTDDDLIYSKAYFDFVTLGEFYTYSEIRGNDIYKEVVPVVEAYPIPNNQFFVEDHDMFARRMRLSYPQIMDMFDEQLSDEDRNFLETYYAKDKANGDVKLLYYDQLFEHSPGLCEKFTAEERALFKKEPHSVYDGNNDLYDVWHVVWKGQVKKGILTYVNEVGFQTQMVVDEDFEFNPELGHINIEWKYETQVFEGYRIGTRYTAIYPIKARAIAYNRFGKLPFNGLLEVIPQFGKFSIIDIIAPYQILRNIISYHREMVIAKNKLLILIMPQSLIEDDAEDRIYKMAADGVLYYDDSVDSNSLKAQQIRLLNASLNSYIKDLTDLMESIKYEAREMVDMTAQRYGEIASSAGKATTEEAIARGSMGSVIISFVFDKCRCRDYNRDLDYAKLAFVDGLNTAYRDKEDNIRYLSLDANSLINSQLSTTVRNSDRESQKFQQLQQWAFSAAQNGDLDMALAAITGNNVSSMKRAINNFMEVKRQHENELKEAEQQLEQMKLQNELQKIQAKGEEERKTKELEYYYELQAKYVDVDLSLLNNDSTSDSEKDLVNERIESGRNDIERMKIQLEREKLSADNYNKAADRNVKREDIKSKIQIAKTNKNKYDK